MRESPAQRITISQRSRPLRFGYLLRGLGDRSGFRAGVRLFTSLWGGMYNCFIPVYRRRPSWWRGSQSGADITRGYLDAFEPDVLVAEDPDLAEGLDYAENRILLTSDLIRQDQYTPFSHGIGVHELFDWMWKEEFQYVKREPPEVVLPQADIQAFKAFVATCFGEYPETSESRPDFERGFRRVFAAKDLPIAGDQLLRLHLEDIAYPLNVGASRLEVRRRGWRSEPLLYLLDPTSPLDLVDFWNLRALGVYPIPVPLPWFDDLRCRLAQFVDESHRPHPHNADLMLCTTVMRGRSLDEKSARAIKEALSADSSGGLTFRWWYPRVWDSFGRDKDHALRAEVTASRDENEIVLASDRITIRACQLPGTSIYWPGPTEIGLREQKGDRGRRLRSWVMAKRTGLLLQPTCGWGCAPKLRASCATRAAGVVFSARPGTGLPMPGPTPRFPGAQACACCTPDSSFRYAPVPA